MRWWIPLLVCTFLGGQRARAEQRPLLVVVEASPRQAAAIRDRVGEALARPVVSLLDAEAMRAAESISVAVTRDGRNARLCYRGRYETRFREVTAPRNAREPSWIALAVVALVQEVRSLAWSAPPEILDPFADDEAHALLPLRIPTDVVDPWERERRRERREGGGDLATPRPR